MISVGGEDEHFPQFGKALAAAVVFPSRNEFVERLEVVHTPEAVHGDEDLGVGLFEDVAHLVPAEQVVDRYRHRARPGDSELQGDELGEVGHVHGHVVPRLDAGGDQAAADLRRPVADVGVGVGPLVGDHQGPLGIEVGGGGEDLVDRPGPPPRPPRLLQPAPALFHRGQSIGHTGHLAPTSSRTSRGWAEPLAGRAVDGEAEEPVDQQAAFGGHRTGQGGGQVVDGAGGDAGGAETGDPVVHRGPAEAAFQLLVEQVTVGDPPGGSGEAVVASQLGAAQHVAELLEQSVAPGSHEHPIVAGPVGLVGRKAGRPGAEALGHLTEQQRRGHLVGHQREGAVEEDRFDVLRPLEGRPAHESGKDAEGGPHTGRDVDQ